MIELLGVHRPDEAEFIGHLRQFWDCVREPGTALSVLGELMRRAQQRWPLGRERKLFPLVELIRTGFARSPGQLRFVVEQIQMRRRPGHVQEDDILRLRSKVRLPREQWLSLINRNLRPRIPGHQRRKRETPQTHLTLIKEVPSCEVGCWMLTEIVHECLEPEQRSLD